MLVDLSRQATSEPIIFRDHGGRSISFQRAAGEDVDKLGMTEELALKTGLSKIAAEILIRRGIYTTEAVKNFLSPSLREHLPNPSEIRNIELAAEILLQASEDKKLVTIYSDFDVDGLSAGSQLFIFLKTLGVAVNHYTPNRFTEGYGLVRSAVEKLAAEGTNILVTVDCGISSHTELLLARKLGLKTIVIDHHLPKELPQADVIVDPAQDGCSFADHKLAAAGLVWMMLIVLRNKAKERWPERIASGKIQLPDPKNFLDLAALGTICDMVPLTGVNRLIAIRGIEALRETTRPGLIALKQVAGVDSNKRLGAGQVAFNLGPRINAAGRLADANDVFRMLTTEDSKRARKIAESLNYLNGERRRVEEAVRVACLRIIEDKPQLAEKPALALFGEDFHAGVSGIVAQRLVEQFHRPVAIMAPGEMLISGKLRPVVKGSVRSIRGFHVADALHSLSHLLVGQGGHAEAGGFTLAPERLLEFQTAFVELAGKTLSAEQLIKRTAADMEVELSEITFLVANDLSRFQPFGVANPAPIFVSRDVRVESVTSIGNKHLRLRVSQGDSFQTIIAWGLQGHALLRKDHHVSIAYQVEVNTYQGVSAVQLVLKEVW